MAHNLYIHIITPKPTVYDNFEPEMSFGPVHRYPETVVTWSGFLGCSNWIAPLPFFGWTLPSLCSCISNGVYFTFEYKWSTSRTQWLRSSLQTQTGWRFLLLLLSFQVPAFQNRMEGRNVVTSSPISYTVYFPVDYVITDVEIKDMFPVKFECWCCISSTAAVRRHSIITFLSAKMFYLKA